MLSPQIHWNPCVPTGWPSNCLALVLTAVICLLVSARICCHRSSITVPVHAQEKSARLVATGLVSLRVRFPLRCSAGAEQYPLTVPDDFAVHEESSGYLVLYPAPGTVHRTGTWYRVGLKCVWVVWPFESAEAGYRVSPYRTKVPNSNR